MKRHVTVLLATGLAAAFLPLGPASAITPAGFDCGPDDGREQVTADGFSLSFEAPHAPGFDYAATIEQTDPTLRRHSTAHFFFRANLVPYTFADLDVSVNWTDTADIDLYVYDDEGNLIDDSTAFNPLDGNGEKVTIPTAPHCMDFSVEVHNYLGDFEQPLTLAITSKSPGPMFACEEEDPHPACAGKAEGEPPVRVEDTRTRLYLSGDRPGQASMAQDYVYETAGMGNAPARGLLSPQRPLGGETNSFTHTALGFTNQQENPFQAHYSLFFTEPTKIAGELKAVLWVSSETLKDGGTLHVDLFSDGTGPLPQTQRARVNVPGAQVGHAPTRIAVTFTGLDIDVEQQLVLQVSSEPLATSGGATGNPADAQWTVYYDSVQFPSGITLDLPDGALATQ